MKNRSLARALAPMILAFTALPGPAEAHHAMGSLTPGNALEGLISGLAHPVIGVDHLLFVIAVGVASYYFGRRNVTAATFVLGTLAGTILHLYQATLPYPDLWVALTLVLLGFLFLRARSVLQSKAALGFFALAGIAHGYAYGESIVGAEPTPLFAYLVGFALVQFAIVLGAYQLTRVMVRNEVASSVSAAVGGALLIAGGGFMFLSLT